MKTIKMFIAMIMLSVSTMAMAQQQSQDKAPQRPTPEKMAEMQWQRVAKKLMLSDDQANKVKPIYEAYVKEVREIFAANKPQKPEADKQKPEAPKQMSDAEVKDHMKKQFAAKRKMIDVQEKYFEKFSKELPPRQAQYLVKSVDKQGGPGKGGKGGKFGKGGFGDHGMQGGNCGMGFGGHGMQPGMNKGGQGMPFNKGKQFGRGTCDQGQRPCPDAQKEATK